MHSTATPFMSFIEKELNDAQRSAVMHKQGPILVCAGAGSGKTRVITARMSYLISCAQVAPSEVIALTFTNKAAREMKERIKSFLPQLPHSSLPFVGTFHSYCLRLLKSNAHLTSQPEFTILDADDQEKLARNVIARFSLTKKVTPKTLLHTISQLKNEATSGVIAVKNISDPLMQRLVIAYEQEKKVSRCFDFDDLLLEALRIFKNNPDFRTQFQQNVRHLLVDEYQDTNTVQHALLKIMALYEDGSLALDSLCVVGDEDQSIYSWRGATVANIMDFRNDFRKTTLVTIEQNYRSVDQILMVANRLIEHNTLRNPKRLWSARQGADRVRLLTCATGYQEADVVALYARQLQQQKTAASLAVLYRSHYQSRVIEEALIRHSIAYTIFGGIRFYERLEIKDLLAYLRLIVNPFDRVALLRTVNTPSRGLGDKFQEMFLLEWDKQPFLSFKDLCMKLIEDKAVPPSKAATLQAFATIFDSLSPDTSAKNALESILRATNYQSHLKEEFSTEDAQAKIENIKELGNAMIALEERGIVRVKDFLDEVALLQENETKENGSTPVVLMTMHAAKGLEFPAVAIVGIEEGILPSGHSIYQPESIEEERRLLYVGITRAEEHLLLCHARYRYTFGQMTDQRASRFIKEIATGPVTEHDASQWQTAQIRDYLSQWLTSGEKAILKKHEPNANTILLAKKQSEGISWQAGQKVRHNIFGIGTVHDIDAREGGIVYLSVKFAQGTKKISAQFVHAV